MSQLTEQTKAGLVIAARNLLQAKAAKKKVDPHALQWARDILRTMERTK